MIVCSHFCGQLGNHLLTMINLIQLTELLKVPLHYHSYYIQKFFDVSLTNYKKLTHLKKTKMTIDSNKLVKRFDSMPNVSKKMLKKVSCHTNLIVHQPFLGELFFRYAIINSNQYIKLKAEFQYPLHHTNNAILVGIHIRDMGAWNKRHDGISDLKPSYYRNAIQFCLEKQSELYTDKKQKLFFVLIGATSNTQSTLGEKCDVSNYLPYQKTEIYLKDHCIPYDYGLTTNHPNLCFIYDWYQLSQCDVMISSAGTFAISAGILGKQNKKIIHSKEWVEYAAGKYDTFWKDLYDGGNDTYSCWKFI